MKAKVIIENGETEIVLTPENDFEEDVLKKVHSMKEKYSLNTGVNSKYTCGSYDYTLVINLKEKK